MYSVNDENELNNGSNVEENVEENVNPVETPSEEKTVMTEPLKAVLCAVYNGENVCVALPEEGFYNNVALLTERILSYSVSPLRGKIDFRIGNADAAEEGKISVFIATDAFFSEKGIDAISAVSSEYVCDINSECADAVGGMLSLDKDSLESFMKDYDVLIGGADSSYRPKKFIDYVRSRGGNAVVTEKLIDSLLAEREEISVKDIPAYATALIRERYASGNHAASILELSTVDELADPIGVLDKNSSSVKKIFLFCDFPELVFRSSFERVLSAIILDDEAFLKLYNGMKSFVGKQNNETKKYRSVFVDSVKRLYNEQLGESARMGACAICREKVLASVPNFFNSPDSAPKRILDKVDTERLIRKFGEACGKYYEKANKYRYDLKGAHISAILSAIERNNETFSVIPEKREITEADVRKLDFLSRAFFVGRERDVDSTMAEISEIYSEFPNIVDFYAAKYAVRNKNTLTARNDSFFISIAANPKRIASIAKLVFDEDPIASLKLVAAYAPASEAVVAAVTLVRTNFEDFNNIDPRIASAAIDTVSRMLYNRLNAAPVDVSVSADIDAAFEAFPERKPNETFFKLEGNIKLFYDSMFAMWTAYGEGKPFIPKKKSNKPLFWAAVAVLVIALIGAIASLVLLFGTLGNDGNASSNDSSDSSVYESSDVSDMIASGDDSSAESSLDNSSDESSEAPVETPESITLTDRNGSGAGVVLKNTSQSGGENCNYALILNKKGDFYTVSSVISAPTNEIPLSEGQVAIAFYLTDDAADGNNESVKAMIDYAKTLTIGDYLSFSDGKTFVKSDTPPETSEPEVSEPETSEPETSEPEVSEPEISEPEKQSFDFEAEYYNKVVNDTHVVVLNQSKNFINAEGYIEYAILLESTGGNSYKITETDSDRDKILSFADKIDSTHIVILFHTRDGISNSDAEAALSSVKALPSSAVFTASGNLSDGVKFTVEY